MRENGVLVVPNGLECVQLAVTAAATVHLDPRQHPEHMYRRALIQTDADIRFTADPDEDNDPTPIFGVLLRDGESLVYDGSLDNLRFRAVSADAVLTIHYFGL